MIRTRHCAIERQVLLDDRCAMGDRGDWDGNSDAVVGKANRQLEASGKRIHGAKIDLVVGRRDSRRCNAAG